MSSRNAQCKIAGVKGISDAVRGAIAQWVTDDLVKILYDAYINGAVLLNMKFSQAAFANRVRNAGAWKRYKRGNDPQGDGFFRQYYCQEFRAKGVVDLRVLTNFDDTVIRYIMFYVSGKMVYAGACNVPSTYFPKLNYQPTIQNPVTPTGTAAFVPFTPAQLEKLAVQYEYGGMAAIDLMFEERVA